MKLLCEFCSLIAQKPIRLEPTGEKKYVLTTFEEKICPVCSLIHSIQVEQPPRKLTQEEIQLLKLEKTPEKSIAEMRVPDLIKKINKTCRSCEFFDEHETGIQRIPYWICTFGPSDEETQPNSTCDNWKKSSV